MSIIDTVLEDFDRLAFEGIQERLEPISNHLKAINKYFENAAAAITMYKTTGRAPIFDFKNWNNSVPPTAAEDDQENGSKENIEPQRKSTRGRSRRNPARQTSSSSSNSNKSNVSVKKEKLSTGSVKIKTEAEEMPAPTKPAPRRKKGKKSERKVEIKQERLTDERGRDSDVILQVPVVPTVNLSDSDSEKNEASAVGRSTRTRTRQQKKAEKRARPESGGQGSESVEKKAKEAVADAANVSTETHYEDAASTLIVEDNANATYVAKSPINKNLQQKPNPDATVVVENPKYCVNKQNNNVDDDLMTDDDSDEDKAREAKPTRPVFNTTYESSPVKKKIEAFEKFNGAVAAAAGPSRVTRTRTRALAKENEEAEQQVAEAAAAVPCINSGTVKEKAKMFAATPTASRFIPTLSSTSVKVSKPHVELSSKSASALKASQAEYRERERKRREREEDAAKKKGAMLQAVLEERRRKREEKQLKAQQHREALEKEKQKQFEAQRLKDERHRLLKQEQEEKKLKMKEEADKKRQLAKQRALEEKKREEKKAEEDLRKMHQALASKDPEMALLAQKKKEERKQIPIYMVTKPPLLPTEDCYDSDEEDQKNLTIHEPAWSKGPRLRNVMRMTMRAAETMKNTFFSRHVQTPDLQEIFEVIDPKKLRRNSSAIWKKQPRYTMMPNVLEEWDEDF